MGLPRPPRRPLEAPEPPPLAWRTLDEWRASGSRERVVLRTLAIGGGSCLYDLGPDEVDEAHARLLRSGTYGQDVMAIPEKTTIVGVER